MSGQKAAHYRVRSSNPPSCCGLGMLARCHPKQDAQSLMSTRVPRQLCDAYSRTRVSNYSAAQNQVAAQTFVSHHRLLQRIRPEHSGSGPHTDDTHMCWGSGLRHPTAASPPVIIIEQPHHDVRLGPAWTGSCRAASSLPPRLPPAAPRRPTPPAQLPRLSGKLVTLARI